MITSTAFEHASSMLTEVLDDPQSACEIQARVNATITMARIISRSHPATVMLETDAVDDFALYVGLCVYDENKDGCGLSMGGL